MEYFPPIRQKPLQVIIALFRLTRKMFVYFVHLVVPKQQQQYQKWFYTTQFSLSSLFANDMENNTKLFFFLRISH
jgi:hypothetical protein